MEYLAQVHERLTRFWKSEKESYAKDDKSLMEYNTLVLHDSATAISGENAGQTVGREYPRNGFEKPLHTTA